MRILFVVFALYLVICGDQLIAQTSSHSEATTISDFAWIAGHWKGESMGGQFEETWNPPLGDSMIGMFKLVKEGKVVFTELVMIARFDGEFKMRVKHFDKNFHGWEEKNKFMEFPFVSVSKDKAVFKGLVMERISQNRLKTTVDVKEGGELKKITFDATRARHGNAAR